MGSYSSKCKRIERKYHKYYAITFKKRKELAIIDSELLKHRGAIQNDKTDMYLTFDVNDMKNSKSEVSSKFKGESVLDCGSSTRLKEIVQFWAECSRENVVDAKPSDRCKGAFSRYQWDDQDKAPMMAPSKGNPFCSNVEEVSRRNVRSSPGQGCNNVRENTIFKTRCYKGSNSSASSLSQKESFSDSKSRKSDSFENTTIRRSKHSIKNVNQLDSILETKSKYCTDNLSDITVRNRDLDIRQLEAEPVETKAMNRSTEKVDLRFKNNADDQETPLTNNDDEKMSNEYIDARWQALCSSNDKEQILLPCPTCGRKFSEEAAYRHFPICSRVKEKGSSIKNRKNKIRASLCNPSSPSFVSVVADESLAVDEKREEGCLRKPCKPIVFTFAKGGEGLSKVLKEFHKPPATAPEKFIKKVGQSKKTALPSLMTGNNNSTGNSKSGSGNSIVHKAEPVECKSRRRRSYGLRSDGVRKSASIWKKSVKEFKTIVDKTTKSTKNKESISSATDESTSSSRLDVRVKVTSNDYKVNAASECHFCPTCGRVDDSPPVEKEYVPEARAKLKCSKRTEGKNRNTNKTCRTRGKYTANMQDLDVVPQSLRIKDNGSAFKKNAKVDPCFNTSDEKMTPCFSCGRLIRSNLLEAHASLCERIKNIELFISKDVCKSERTPHRGAMHSSNSKKHVSLEDNSNEVKLGSCKDYRLCKQGIETPSTTGLRIIASVKCPCCSQLLDLRHHV